MSSKPLRADARRNCDAIIAKAREALESGCLDLRFDDFARLACVGVGTLYRHFPTREALVDAVYREEVEALCARGRALAFTRAPSEALAAFLRDLVAYVDAHRGLAAAFATFAGGNVQLEGARAVGGTVVELVAAAVAAGEARDDLRAGSVMMGLKAACETYDQPGWREDADGLVTLLIEGMRPVR